MGVGMSIFGRFLEGILRSDVPMIGDWTNENTVSFCIYEGNCRYCHFYFRDRTGPTLSALNSLRMDNVLELLLGVFLGDEGGGLLGILV